MEKEIEVAVNWWAEKLRHPAEHDNGDAFQSDFCTMLVQKEYRPLTEDQIGAFKLALAHILRKNFAGNWRPEQPIWGGYNRAIYNDYHPAMVLIEAMTAAGIDRQDFRFPIKTSMDIDPGKVSVREGYGAPTEVIYESVTASETAKAE